jgi:glutamate racemase
MPTRIAVVGGTSFDSNRGALFLKESGIHATPIGLSATPDEQSALYKNPDEVVARFAEKVQPEQFDKLLIYCNSLSFIADWQALYPGKMWELKNVYKAVMQQTQRSSMAIWVAENTMKHNLAALLDELGLSVEKGIQIMPKLELVKRLEQSSEVEQKQLISSELQRLYEEGYEEVVFACTHFDHPSFNHHASLHIYQPGLAMLNHFAQDHH